MVQQLAAGGEHAETREGIGFAAQFDADRPDLGADVAMAQEHGHGQLLRAAPIHAFVSDEIIRQQFVDRAGIAFVDGQLHRLDLSAHGLFRGLPAAGRKDQQQDWRQCVADALQPACLLHCGIPLRCAPRALSLIGAYA